MATMVGTQAELSKLLNALIELDFDAIAAYDEAIKRIDDAKDRSALQSFRADHARHVKELSVCVTDMGEQPATEADMKAILTKGKVIVGGLMGDRAILMAMKTNEDDTNTAYERACNRTDLPAHLRTVLTGNLADERRHRAYIEQRIGAQSDPQYISPS